MHSPIENMILLKKIKSYARVQGRLNSLSLLIFTLSTTILSMTIALFLLKSYLYGLLGLIPLLFYQRRGFELWAKELDKKIDAKGEFISALQLARIPDNTREGYSKDLINAFIQSTEEKFRDINVKDFLDWRILKKSISILLISIIFALSFLALFPERFWFALNHKIEYKVTPCDGRFNKGEDVDIGINLFGPYIPERVSLIYQFGSKLEKVSLPVIRCRADKKFELKEPFYYYFEFAGITTEKYRIDVVEPIYLKELSFHLIYPEYTKLKDEIETGRQLVVPVGTIVEVKGLVSQNLAEAWIEFGDTINLFCNGESFSGRFKINKSGLANLWMKGTSLHKELINIYAIPDLAPLVEIFYPGFNISMPQDMKVTLGIKFSDDYGINRVHLCYQFKDSSRVNLNFNKGSAEDTVFYDWDLKNLGMLPGDRVTYYVEVQDNAGQRTKSKEYYIYFPTMEQIYDEVKEKEELVQNEIKELKDSHQEGMDEIKRVEEKLKRERELSWLDNEKLKEVIKKEENVVKKIEEWQDELKKTIEKLKGGIFLDQKSLERLQEITKILQEIAPEELKRAIENLQNAMNKKPDELKKAMEDLKEAQEELARALERTLEILKRYQQEEKLKELAEKAKEIAEKAGEIESLRELKGMENIKESLDSLYKMVDSLGQEIEKLANSEGLEQEISAQLNFAAGQVKSIAQAQNMSPEELKKELNRLSTDLQRMYEELTKGRVANLRRNLLETLNQLIELSQLEEELLTPEGFDPDKQSKIANATKEVAESLYAQQVKSLYVSPETGKRLARALKEMEFASLNPGDTKRHHIQEAMKQLNLAALTLLEGLKKASEGSGSSTGMDEFLKNLSQLTRDQMGIGQSLMSLFPIPVSGLTPEQMAQIQRLAGKQRELREALESLKNSPEAGRFQDLLDNLGQEMKETEEALYQYKIDRKLIERQQLIISRLLDAERSIRQEDWTKERKSKPGEDIKRPSPAPLSEDLGKDQLLEIIQRALKQPHPEEYELLIREYFKALMEQEWR
uniref:DUF4175 family protein n=1 Tax=candidate division WOR-3 bacterium TaxID=2052148 RepID=A0A7V3RH07_UNCW3